MLYTASIFSNVLGVEFLNRQISPNLSPFMKKLLLKPLQYKMINGDQLFTIEQLKEIVDKFTCLQKSRRNLHNITKHSVDVLIIGDIHGDMISLQKIVKPFFNNQIDYLIFLGDYVDRGKDSLLVLMYICVLSIAFPGNIVPLRGNHEDLELNQRYGFAEELHNHFPDEGDYDLVIKYIDVLYNYLSLSAITPMKSFCVHGGIASGIEDVNTINEIPKPHSQLVNDPDIDDVGDLASIMKQLNWNDPLEDMELPFHPSLRGFGVNYYGKSAVDSFLSLNELERIVRAHESSRGGFDYIFNGKVIHIFSSEPYFGKIDKAYVLHETADNHTILRDLDFNEISKLD